MLPIGGHGVDGKFEIPVWLVLQIVQPLLQFSVAVDIITK
jgi:hypothetical protein